MLKDSKSTIGTANTKENNSNSQYQAPENTEKSVTLVLGQQESQPESPSDILPNSRRPSQEKYRIEEEEKSITNAHVDFSTEKNSR